MGAVRRADGTSLIDRCHRTGTWRSRLVGLLGTADLTPDEGLWLEPCSSVHTFGMRIPIACVFLDETGTVLRIVPALRPWRAAAVRGARAVVEMLPQAVAGLGPGDVLTWSAATAEDAPTRR